MSTSSVYESAHKGDFNRVKEEVEKNPRLITVQDSNKRILLHWAALSGSVQLVLFLLEFGSPVDPVDDTETVPLILASSAGKHEIVDILIEKGADVNHKSAQGHSSLQYACSKGWEKIVEKLVENKADINIVDFRGATPLHRAASKGNFEIVKMLTRYKDILNINACDTYGNSALHLAAEEDRQDVAVHLVEHGADMDLLNKDKKTPLDLCTYSFAKILSKCQKIH